MYIYIYIERERKRSVLPAPHFLHFKYLQTIFLIKGFK